MDGRWRVMAKVKYVGKVHEPIQSCKKHAHEYWEVVRYTRGRGYVEMGEGRVPFEEGDILVIPPHTVHSDHSENGFQNYHYEFEDNAFPFHTWLRLYDNENHDFLDITEKLYREYQLQYKAEYFIAVNTKDKRRGRAAKRGKKITINGIEFFTDSPPLEGENAIYITHARTGLACGTVELVKKHWEQFIKAQEKVADINTLPLAEYDEKSRKYLIKEVSQCANP